MSAADLKNLGSKSKTQLIEMVKNLAAENEIYKELQHYMETTNKRLENLEREQNKSLQYMRRDSVEISGIPLEVPQASLEDAVIKIYAEAGVEVHGEKLDAIDIQACHRIGKKGITICKFTNRKYAREGLVCGKNLRNTKLYGE